jgi:hypothetical protein
MPPPRAPKSTTAGPQAVAHAHSPAAPTASNRPTACVLIDIVQLTSSSVNSARIAARASLSSPDLHPALRFVAAAKREGAPILRSALQVRMEDLGRLCLLWVQSADAEAPFRLDSDALNAS